MSRFEPRRIGVDGTVLSVCLVRRGDLCVLVRTRELAVHLLNLDISGNALGRIEFPQPDGGSPAISRSRMKASRDGRVWISHANALVEIGLTSVLGPPVPVPVEQNEVVGAFLIVPDGFVVALHRGRSAEPQGRVLRLDGRGNVIWKTVIPAGALQYSGVAEMRADSGWQLKTKSPWQPSDWQPVLSGEPLILAGNRLLVRFMELRSGLGQSFGLDWDHGAIAWSTEPRPQSSVALIGPQTFLMGSQGYGAYDLYSYDRDGQQLQHWPSHANVVVTENGEFVGIEMENRIPSRMHVAVFRSDGTVHRGRHLEGYYSTYPVVSSRGTVAFWRDGQLHLADTNGSTQIAWKDRSLADKMMMTRMLLADDGTLAFGLEDELFLFPTDLGPMAMSCWPCDGGNLEDNPAFVGPG